MVPVNLECALGKEQGGKGECTTGVLRKGGSVVGVGWGGPGGWGWGGRQNRGAFCEQLGKGAETGRAVQ